MCRSRSCRKLSSFLLLTLSAYGAWSCGGGKPCDIAGKQYSSPECRSAELSVSREFSNTSASCTAVNSRKMVVSCVSTSGSQSQCGTRSEGAAVVSILLPATQTKYATCNDVLTAFATRSLTEVSGVYISDIYNTSDTVRCSSGSCVLTTASCYAGWDVSSATPLGTANLPNGNQYHSCTYIDTGAIGLIPIAAGGNWAADVTLSPVTIAGDLTFNAGWVDAY
ncbi:MAG TPA: hypothetical protein VIH99_12790 [Bdellovibrionota bacterium]|jgi:hypothetical protein